MAANSLGDSKHWVCFSESAKWKLTNPKQSNLQFNKTLFIQLTITNDTPYKTLLIQLTITNDSLPVSGLLHTKRKKLVFTLQGPQTNWR